MPTSVGIPTEVGTTNCQNEVRILEDWVRQQTICITGGGGALGKCLLERLLAMGAHRIIIFDNRPPPQQFKPFKQVSYFQGDILNPTNISQALEGCTILFHLAALIHVGRSISEPLRYFEVNAFGTAQLLDVCRQIGVRQVIYTSTGHVYGLPKQLPVNENHPTNPLSVYAASKLAGEVVMQGYAASYGLSCEIVRLANIYGASLNVETVVGLIVKQAITEQVIRLRNLNSIRDFIHVNDVVEALLRLAMSGTNKTGCRVVNLSTGQGASILEVAQHIAKIAVRLGFTEPEIIQTSNQAEQVSKLILDNRLLQDLTDWFPETSLETGLTLTMQKFFDTEKN